MLEEETGGATRGDASSMAEGAMTCLLPCSRSSEDEGSRGGRGRGRGGWTSAGLETGATTWIRRGGAWGGDAMEDGDEAEAKELLGSARFWRGRGRSGRRPGDAVPVGARGRGREEGDRARDAGERGRDGSWRREGGEGDERERWGSGAAARVRGAPAGPWAGLGWPGLRGRLGCKALFSLSKENKNKTEIGKKRKRG